MLYTYFILGYNYFKGFYCVGYGHIGTYDDLQSAVTACNSDEKCQCVDYHRTSGNYFTNPYYGIHHNWDWDAWVIIQGGNFLYITETFL